MKRTIGGTNARVAPGVLLIAVSVIMVITGIRIEFGAGDFYLWFEAESGEEIEPPMVVVDDSESSEGRCIEIKQGSGTGMLGSRGTVRYHLPVSAAGDYVLWARVYWLDGCSNSFFVVAGGNNFHFGEDADFNAWHWVRMDLPLRGVTGRLEMTIRNREDGIKIDKFLLTNDPGFVPRGEGDGVFVCDFDDGSVDQWNPDTPVRWHVAAGEGLDGSAAYYLAPSGEGGVEYSLWNVKPAGEYVYRCIARSAQPDGGDVRLIFDYRNGNEFDYVEFVDGKAVVTAVSGGMERVVGESIDSMRGHLQLNGAYHCYEIHKRSGEVLVKVDGMPCVLAPARGGSGVVGVGSARGAAWFDDVYVSGEQDIRLSQNFYYDVEAPTDVAAGWSTVGGNWVRSVTLTPLSYEVTAEGLSIALTGEKYWNNYRYDVCVQGDGESGVGMLFYYYDAANAYLFRWGGMNSTKQYAGKVQLLKVVDGVVSLLAEAPGGYRADQWYRLGVSIVDGVIRTYIDGRPVFDVVDRTVFQGRVGLWVDGHEGGVNGGGVCFWPGRYSGERWRHQFAVQIDRGNFQRAVYFCYRDDRNYYVLQRAAATDSERDAVLRLFQVIAGAPVLLGQKYDVLRYPKTYSIVIERLGDVLRLSIREPVQKEIGDIVSEEKLSFEITHPLLTDGRIGYDTGRAVNARFDDVVVHGMNGFFDSFDGDEPGSLLLWRQLRGNWETENGAMTFSSSDTAIAIAGRPDWSRYDCSVDVELPGDSVKPAGMLFYYLDENNNYRLDLSRSGSDVKVALIKRHGGAETVLGAAIREGPLRSFEPFRVGLADGWIDVYSRGERVTGAYDSDLKGGAVGLFGYGARSAFFDNLEVSFDADDRARDVVAVDFSTYDEAAVSANGFPGWALSSGRCSIHRGSLVVEPADAEARLEYRDAAFYGSASTGCLARVLEADDTRIGILLYKGGGDSTGYRFAFDRNGISLYKDGIVVASSTNVRLQPMVTYELKIEKRGGSVVCFVNGECVVVRGYEGRMNDYRAAVSVDGGRIAIDEIRIRGFPEYHYDFSLAKLGARDLSNWSVESGDWNVISFHGYGLHGEKTSSGDASIRFKNLLPPNAAIEFELYPLATQPSGHFIVSVYDDGTDYYSGYFHHIEYRVVESGRNSALNFVRVIVMKGDRVLESEDRVVELRDDMKTKFRIVKIDSSLKLYISNTLMYELYDEEPPRGRMMTLGVMGERYNPVFLDCISVYAID